MFFRSKTDLFGLKLFLVFFVCMAAVPEVIHAETEYFLAAPITFPKSPYKGLSGKAGVEAAVEDHPRTQLEKYYEGYWGPFWGVMSYGKYIADVKVADYSELPWSFGPPAAVASNGFPEKNYTRSTIAGEGDWAATPTADNTIIDFANLLQSFGVDTDLANDTSISARTQVWTPGERYSDINGVAGFQYMEEWWDAADLDESKVNKFINADDKEGNFDQYGELFADYDGSQTWGANVDIVVYTAYLDKGSASSNVTERTYGVAGDGFLGGPNSALGGNVEGKRATKTITVNELMLNTPDHFSSDNVVDNTIAANLTGDRDWTQYVADKAFDLNMGTAGNGINNAEVNAITADNVFTYGYNVFTKITDGTFYRTVEGVNYGETSIVQVNVDVYQAYEVEGGIEDGDGFFTARDPFEDFLVRWEPWYDANSDLTEPSGGWVPVTHTYINANYPGDTAALITRSSNNQRYDAAEGIIKDHGSFKIRAKHPGGAFVKYFDYPDSYVPSTEYLLDNTLGNADHTGGTYSDNRMQGFTANVMTSKVYDVSDLYSSNGGWDVDASSNIYGQINIWYNKVFGTEVGGGGNHYPHLTSGSRWKHYQWELDEFDIETEIGGGLITPADINYSTAYFSRIHDDQFGAGFAGGNFATWGTIGLNGNLINSGCVIGVVHNLKYDAPREFRDLPAALHNMGGDFRLGEMTGPGSGGARYPDGQLGAAGAQGYDAGAHDPASPAGPDQVAALAGPLFVRGYGVSGYDGGDVTHMELLTWNTAGDASSSNHVVDGVSKRVFLDITSRHTRDINLDGLIDQGYSPPLGYSNYLHDGNGDQDGFGESLTWDHPNSTGAVTASVRQGYPFTRERGIEDTLKILDAALYFDDFTEGSGKIDYVMPLYARNGYGAGMWAGPSGITFNMYTEDYSGLTEVWGHSDPNPDTGGRAKHEAFHDLWGLQDLYDYDIWNGLAESFPISNFDVMSGGPYTMTPVSKIFTDASNLEAAPITIPRDLRTVLVPGEETILELYPVNLVENDDQYYFYGRFLDEDNVDTGSVAGNIFEGYEGAYLNGEGYYFYYDNGYIVNNSDDNFADGMTNGYSPTGISANLYITDPDDPTNMILNPEITGGSSFGMQGVQILHQDYFPLGEGEPLQQRSGSHFRFEIVEADGLGRMRDGILTSGDTGAVWGYVNKIFNYSTIPKSRWWDGDDTGIEIIDIQLPEYSNPPTQEQIRLPAKVTFLWKEQLVPNLTFTSPPEGKSFDGEYTIEADVWDRYGASTVTWFRESDDEGYDNGILLTGTSAKSVSGVIQMRKSDAGLTTLANGGYYYFAFLNPGSSDKGTEKKFFAMPDLNVGKGIEGKRPMIHVTPGTDAFNLTAGNTQLSSVQRFTLSCNNIGGDGEATFTVVGSLTGPEPGLVTAGAAGNYTTINNFTGYYDFRISTGSGNFGLEDRFLVYTTGLTAYSEAILVEDGDVVQDDPNTFGLVTSPLTGDVAEGGTTASFGIKLNTRPSSDVVVQINNPDTSEVTLDKTTIIFTPDLNDTFGYWKFQNITVTGIDDELSDGDQEVEFTFTVTSEDSNYSGVASIPVKITNKDDEKYGLKITADQRFVAESDNLQSVGATLEVSLRNLPTRDVKVFLSTSDASEGNIINNAANLLTFTPDNWNSTQEVYVSGVDDTPQDGDQEFFVTFRLDSDDNNYNLLESNYKMTCVDDDVASVIVGEVSNDLYESGIPGTFSVRLSQKPQGDVKVSLRSLQPNVAIVDVQQLVFNTTNFSTPQVVTIFPMENDDLPSNELTGAESAIITFDPLVSTADTNYNTLQPSPFAIEVFDNDGDGFTVSKVSNNTDENGRTATFHVFLQTAPAGNVVVDVTSTDITEGTVKPSQLSFTPSNWNGKQLVTITGVDEQLTDGGIPYTIKLAVNSALTTDSTYLTKDPRDVTLLNIDNESAGIVLEPLDRITDELRGRGSFRAYLTKSPSSSTTLVSTSSDTSEGRFSSGNSQVVFDSTNYKIPQNIFINGVTDNDEDGNISYVVKSTLAGAADYEVLTPKNIFMINLDKELPAIAVTPVTADVSESGATATFSVKLLKELPKNGRVYLDLSASSDEITLSASQLVFNENNYSSPQVVTITGKDDSELDGNVPVYVSISVNSTSNSDYLTVRTPDVRLFNLDNDQPGLNLVGSDYSTSEDGDSASFTFSLFTKPTANLVKVKLKLSAKNEASFSTSSNLIEKDLIFLASTWSTGQSVTIYGVEGLDSTDLDGDVPYSMSITFETSDVDYSALTIPDVTLVNLDNDSPRVNFYEAVTGSTNLFSYDNLETTEAGGNVSFSVNLQVAGNLTLRLESSDNTEGNILVPSNGLPASNVNYVFFNEYSGNTYGDKVIVIEGVDDADVDGDVSYFVDITVLNDTSFPSDTFSTNLSSPYLFEIFENPVMANLDDDQAKITFPSGVNLQTLSVSGNTDESGNTATFQIALNSVPEAGTQVFISVASNDEEEFKVKGQSDFIFVDKTPQTVTLEGVQDDFDDGTQSASLIFTLNSDDPNYGDLAAPSPLTVYNDDDGDTAGYTVTLSAVEVDEGKALTVSVNLHSRPLANVEVAFSYNSIESTSGVVEATASLTFAASEWEDTKTTVLQTIDNGQDRKTAPFTFDLVSVANSSDTKYSALAAQEVGVKIKDDDNAGIATPLEVSGNVDESGQSVLLGIRLGAEPLDANGNVILDITSGNTAEIKVEDSVVVFDQSNWSVKQYVKLVGVADNVEDGNKSVLITVSGNANSVYAETDYQTFASVNVTVDNYDIDAPGIVFYDFEPNIDEEGGFNTFRVGLLAAPTNEQKVQLDFKDFDAQNQGFNGAANLQISANHLIFDATDYRSGKIVTLKFSDNVDVSADEARTVSVVPSIVVGSGNGTPSNYQLNLPATETLTFNVVNTDAPGLVVTSDGKVTSEFGQRVTVSAYLRTQPTGTVTVNLSVDRNKEAALTTSTLTFTTANYSTPQTFSVVGLNDSLIDGSIDYVLRMEAFGGGYAGQVKTLNLTNVDDDSASVRILPIEKPFTAEWDAESSILLELSHAPAADRTVSVKVTVSDNTEAEPVDADGIVFFEAPTSVLNGYTANVIIKGLNDSLADGHQTYQVNFSDLISDDPNFNGLPVGQVSLINYDDETSGIQISLAAGNGNLITQEYNWGGNTSLDHISATNIAKLSTNTFDVQLLSQPAFGNVVINVKSDDQSEGVVKSGEQLVFTPANYNVAQTVEVAGRDDGVSGESLGDTSYLINLSIDSSTTDLFYRSFPDRGVPAINEEADLFIKDTPNIDILNSGVYDLLAQQNGSLNLSVSGGRPNYVWSLVSAPAGSSLDVSSSSLFQSGVSNNTSVLNFAVGSVSGDYKIEVSDDQITPESYTYEFYLRGSPVVKGTSRPTVDTLIIYFEDTAIDDRTKYVVEHSRDGVSGWRSLPVLSDKPKLKGSSKAQRRSSRSKTSEYELTISFPEGGQSEGQGYFRITAASSTDSSKTTTPMSATAVTSAGAYTPKDPDNTDLVKVLSGSGSGGGGGGGCLLK